MVSASQKNKANLTTAAFLLTLLGILLAAMFFTSLPAHADPDLDAKQEEVDQLRAEVAEINRNAAQAIERYNQANVELEQTRQQLVANEEALADATARLAESQNILERRIENIYRHGSTGFIEVLFDSASINEFLSQYDMLGRIGEQDKEIVEQVYAYRTEVEEARVELEHAQEKQQELVNTLAAEKGEIEGQLAARESVLAGAEAEVAQLFAEEERRQQEAAASQASPGAGQSGGPGNDTLDPAPGNPAPPPPSSGGAVSIASQYLGVPYVWGGASPSGFDCSGLVMYVYAQMGVYLPHSAAAQYYAGTPVSYSQLAPGDLVFFGQPIYHVGIYAGGGSMIHAPYPGASVSYSSVSGLGDYSGACRI